MRNVAALIEQETSAAQSDLTSGPEGEGTDLPLLGLAVVAAWIAAKVVVPMVCAFVSRLLYDKYKEISRPSQVAQAVADLESQADDTTIPVDEAEVITNAINSMIAEGVAAETAHAVAESTYTRLSHRLKTL